MPNSQNNPNPAAGGSQPDGAQNTANQTSSGGTQTQSAAGAGQNRTFTQEELEDILGERLAREREKFKDYDELKKASDELSKLKQAQMTELEKAQAAAKAAEEEKQKVLAMANERLIKGEVKAAAAELGFVDADAAYALLDKAQVKIQDNGTVDGVKPALEALLKAKPYLNGQAKPGSVGTGTNPGAGNVGKSDMNKFIRRMAGR